MSINCEGNDSNFLVNCCAWMQSTEVTTSNLQLLKISQRNVKVGTFTEMENKEAMDVILNELNTKQLMYEMHSEITCKRCHTMNKVVTFTLTNITML